jgi:subtilisin-like proprotein convertase family protein
MPLRTRTWFIISALCFLAAVVFWQLAGRKAARDKAAREAAATNAPAGPGAPAATPAVPAVATNAAAAANDPLRLRLSNTAKGVDELTRSDHALLLRNAHLDSTLPLNLPIPPHLRTQGDPGSYVVQSRGPLTAAYRATLRQAGAEIVSYVPNNAYLVRASQAAAQQLAALPDTQAVLPWEPYYKLDTDLLELAVEQKPLPTTRMLNVLVFAGDRQAVEQALTAQRAVVVAEDRSPFGLQLVVRPRRDGVVPIAQLPGVQAIETFHPRALMNDLARARVRVSTNTVVAQTFQNLTGEGILVNVNDTGVWAGHPDLSGRVSGDSAFTLEDFAGHGTHVAGTIASSGANGPTIPPRNIPGSVSNATFRGMAPGASIYALPLDIAGPVIGDTYYQENAARTNAFISNNSWGYLGSRSYNLAAASWDAAVRDALPGMTGSQPLLAVFAGGNSGDAGIDSPGTAKNVITVGALENMRYITNVVTVIEDGETNKSQKWLGMTDTNNQVAGFSSVGNVGRRREGETGRFKPDVVAPGTFTVSTRSTHWVQPTNLFSSETIPIRLVTLRPGESETFTAFVPKHGWSLEVETLPNAQTRGGVPPINIYIQPTTPPVPPAGFEGTNYAKVGPPIAPRDEVWHFTVENPGSTEARFDVRAIVTWTNNVGDEPEQLFTLNEQLAPYYRYESGTSMAAPAVSGVLALMQEYFGTRGLSNSPAMMKALLINGARNANDEYDFDVGPDRNLQGWGLVNLTNNLPLQNFSAQPSEQSFSSDTMVCLDQSPGRALATGQSFTRVVNVAANARTSPLRFTLVWTDPPGNPAVGVKLVNDLDLVVTNLATGAVYVGNAFGPGNLFSPISPTNSTNGLVLDRVNNVENVYINGSFNQRLTNAYSVTVSAKRVNVNAVTAHPDDVVQDFALVISHGNPRTVTGAAITVTPDPIIETTSMELTTVTNGVPLLNQRVGANSPLIPGPHWTNGSFSQWHFFIVTNQLPPSDPQFTNSPTAAATNIAFATFLPPNLSLIRSNGADIDLYVSQNPALTNLDPAVIATSRRSVRRGGTESVVFTLADGLAGGETFYAGVKSEDQQAANFGFFAVSSSSAFSQSDSEGNVYIEGFPFNAEIPDGSPAEPQAAFMFAFCLDPITIQNVVVTNWITHTNGGDLFGALDLQGQKVSVLNANRGFSTLFPPIEYIYDDSGSGEFLPTDVTDTPGTLRNFVGEEGLGQWRLTMVDSAPGATGQVNRLFIRLEPVSEDLTNGVGVVADIQPGGWFRTVVDVPPDATNLLVCVAQDEGPLIVHIARGFDPDQDNYDTFAVIPPPGDCLSIGRRDVPPLSAGRYFIGIFNPNNVPVNARIKVFIERDLTARTTVAFRSDFSKELLDDAVTNSTIFVGRPGVIADLSVGVRIAHPRVSDLVLHLISPQGTRLLLAENRGGLPGADYGFGSLVTNVAPTTDAGDARASTNIIGLVDTEGVLQVDYQFYTVPDRMTVYYDNSLIFDSGLISGAGTFSVNFGPGVSTNILIVMNEGTNPNAGTRWTYTATIVSGYVFTTFTDDTIRAPTPIKFAVPPFTNFNYFATNFVTNGIVLDDGFEDGLAVDRFYFAPNMISGWQLAVGGLLATRGGAATAPWFLRPDTGARFVELNGEYPPTLRTSFSTVAGSDYRVSFAYAQRPGNATPAQARVSAGPTNAGPANSLTVTAPAGPTGVWSRAFFDFTAATTESQVEIAATAFNPWNGEDGMLLDSVKVEQVDQRIEQGIYYQPEEPITEKPFGKLVGENARGPWTLEVWDNRVGAAITNGSLLAWKLNITYVNTNPPTVTLTNGAEFCSTLRPNETAYFLIDVPISAGAATNLVTASENVTFRYNATGLPTGAEPPDTVFFADEPGGETILDGNGWNSRDANGNFLGGAFTPQLRPGFRYYLSVENRFPGTNAFCLRVSFDDASGTFVPITHISPTNVPPCVTGGVTTNGISYYSFDVSSNAIGAEFSVSNIVGGDVHLYVKRGFPVPNPNRYFAKSENAAPVDYEFIQVADFTGTLLPGRWYLAVVGVSGIPTYEVCAREIPGPVTPLTAGVCYPDTVSTNSVRYYSVVISSNAFQADFQTFAASGNVDLYISTNEMVPLLVSPTNALFASTNIPSGDELIQLSVFDPNMLLTPGTWYLAVVNKDTVPVDYTVCVRQFTTNIDYITLVSGVPHMAQAGVTASNAIAYYRFVVSPNALQAVFETFATSGDVDLYIRSGFPLPPPATNRFDFASTNTPSGDEWIGLVAGDTNRLLRPGTSYWIAVVPRNPNTTVNFKIRATQILRSEVARLFNGVEVCRAIPLVDTNALHSGVQFHRFDVTTNAIQVLFETYSANGNVDLYAQYGLPITNYSLLTPISTGNFLSSETAGGNESICLLPSTAPLALQAGSWYLAVVNRETNLVVVNGVTNDVNYCIRASAVEVRRLADGVTRCDFLNIADGSAVNGIRYYRFDIATNAVQATFETFFQTGDVDLYLRKAPTLVDCTSYTGDFTAFPGSSTNAGPVPERLCLLTNTSPMLMAGEWELAVVNRQPNAFVSFCVRASQVLDTRFTPATNGVATCRQVGPANGPASASVDFFIVTITNDPVLATFETFNATGNVDLFVGRYNRDECLPSFPVTNPNPSGYFYVSANPGTAPECITLTTNTAPVALTNGEWIVAVVNRSLFPVDYCFLATQFTNDPNVRLTNDVALCGQTVPPTNAAGGIGVNYYVFTVSPNALQATFETFNATGNVDLYLQNGFCFQNRDTFDLARINAAYASTNSGTNAESICVHGQSLPVPLLPGEWHLAVVNRDTNDVTFCVRVRELLDTDIVGLTNRIGYSPAVAPLPGEVDYYRYRVSPDAVQVNVEILQPAGDVNLFLDPGFCPENLANFSYASTNAGTANELISVATNSAPVPLSPGQWLIAVTNADTFPAGYTIRVTELLASDIIPLTNAAPYTNTVDGLGSTTGFPVNYYVYNVSTNAVRAQFEILSPSGNVNLVARKGLPLPTLASHDYASTNSGTSDELIVVFNNSAPVPLTPGDWYLSALNATSNAVTYTVVATEYASAGTNFGVGHIAIVSNSLFCITWTNVLPGVNYYVQGKADLNATAWLPVSPTIKATSTSLTWCLQLPSPYRFFRLVEGLSPLSAGNPITFTGMTVGTNGSITFTWTAPANQRYGAEWSATLFPPSWQPYPDYITSTNTSYTFTDDGSKTGGLGGSRFYRFFLVP